MQTVVKHTSPGLPKPPNVKTVAEGPEGVLASITKDKIWVDHSTTDYEQTEVSILRVFVKVSCGLQGCCVFTLIYFLFSC